MVLNLKRKFLARNSYNVWDSLGENIIGKVLSAAYSPVLEVGIGTTFLKNIYYQNQNNKNVLIEIRDKKIEAFIQKGSFIKKAN